MLNLQMIFSVIHSGIWAVSTLLCSVFPWFSSFPVGQSKVHSISKQNIQTSKSIDSAASMRRMGYALNIMNKYNSLNKVVVISRSVSIYLEKDC